MARVHRLSRSNVEHTCRRGHVIPKGEPYSWAAPGFRGRKKYACKDHPFKGSELINGLASEPTAAVEAFEETLDQIDTSADDALDQITSALEDLVGSVTDYADQRQEALDAWENGNSQLEDYVYVADEARDTAEGHEVEEWSGDEEARDDEDHDDHEDAMADWMQHVEEQIEAARDMASGLEF